MVCEYCVVLNPRQLLGGGLVVGCVCVCDVCVMCVVYIYVFVSCVCLMCVYFSA